MALTFNGKDYYALAACLIIMFFGGMAGHVMGWTQSTESAIRFMTATSILLGLIALRRNLPALDGEYARNMEMVGIGTAYFLISWLPHIGWHVEQRPEILGLSRGFWTGIFHSWNAVSFLVITYGIYRFHKSINGDETGPVSVGPLNLHMGRKDFFFLGLSLLIVLLTGLIGQIVGFNRLLSTASTYIQIPFILAGLYYVYRLRGWGGKIGRNLQLIGLGLMMIMINWIPHIPWHMNGMPVMGISQGFWLGFFHSWVIAGFLMISYAFNEL